MVNATINYRITRPRQDGVDVPAEGTVECRPTLRRYAADESVILPASFTAPLVNGVAVLVLAVPGLDWAWTIEENVNRGKTRTVTFDASATTAEDLVDVDPATLSPDVEPEAAWWAALDDRVPDDGTDGYVLTKGEPNFWGPPSGSATVTSVNGETGDVVLDAADVGAATTAQGALADTAVQPADLAAVATTGDADDVDDTTSVHKFVTAADKTKLGNLSGVNTGDQDLSGLVPKTTQVNGHPLSGDIVVTKADVGLSNVDNTSDANKPVSTAQQTALNGKQDLDSDLTDIAALAPANDDILQRKAGAWTNRTPAQVKTDLALTKGDVGLANVDNTSDADKPVSTATQDALEERVPAGGTDGYVLTKGTPDNTWEPPGAGGAVDSVNGQTGAVVLDAADVGAATTAQGALAETAVQPGDLAAVATTGDADDVDDSTATHKFVTAGDLTKLDNLSGVNTGDQDLSGLVPKTTQVNGHALSGDVTVTKSDVGLANVDNTSDANKPVSTAQQTALNGKQDLDSDLTDIAALTPTNDDLLQRKAGAWTNRTPAQVKTDLALTKGDVGLSNVDNTSDANKPVSTAQQTALNGKQDLDSDLTAIAALAPTNDDILQRKAGAWTNRTPAQVKTDLALTKADVGLSNVDNTSDATKNSAAATLTNKAITKRVQTVISTATLNHAASNYDMSVVTAQAAALAITASGSPTQGQSMLLRIKDDGTARTISWNAIFRAIGVTLPTTTIVGKTLYIGAVYNSTDTKWDVIAVAQEA